MFTMFCHLALPRLLTRLCACVLLLGVLTACGEDTLYTNLSEREANEMTALLMRYDIAVTRAAGTNNTYSISVGSDRFADATEILSSFGYPKTSYSDLGQIFAKEGLVATPMQERVKFLHGMNQEISKTISEIDGVVSARVHITMPEKDPLVIEQTAPSASVVIRYDKDARLSEQVPQIKMIVASSVEGLAYDSVSVALFPVDTGVGSRALGPAAVAESAKTTGPGTVAAIAMVVLALAMVLVLGGFAGWRYLQFRRMNAATKPSAPEASAP